MNRLVRILLVACVALAGLTVPAAPAQAGTYHNTRCYDNGADEYHTRAEVLSRARSWVSDAVTYSQERCYTNSYGDYRTDCSGLLSMAWGLGGLGDTWGTVNLDERSTRISAGQLLPGDALLRYTGDPGVNHVALFVRWSDAAHTKPVVIEQSGGPGRAVERTWTSGFSGYAAMRYHRIGTPAGISLYGVTAAGHLTYSLLEPGSGARLKSHVSATALGFTPKAMSTLNFNTVLVTSATGQLYRVDVITNNNTLGHNAPVYLGGGWTHDLLSFDGNGHLFGIAAGTLHRYTITAAKPAPANITANTVISSGFTLKTLAATGPDWILGTTSGGQLLSYRIRGAGDWTRYALRSSTWQVFDHLASPGFGLYYAHRPEGTMFQYVDANAGDGSGADLQAGAPLPSSWPEVLLSASPL